MRTRAFGWSAHLVMLLIMKLPCYRSLFGGLVSEVETILSETELDARLWDVPQVLRSLTRRFLMQPHLIDEDLMRKLAECELPNCLINCS